MSQPPILIPIEEVARLLCLSSRTIRRMRNEGRLPPPVPLRVKTLLWNREQFLLWIRDQSRQAAEEAGWQPPGARLAQDAPPRQQRGR